MKYLKLFLIFLRLGLTSFGGPVAHLSYLHHEFVTKRKWLSDDTYADVVALCQFLPGPASSQVGMAIGLLHSGIRGSLVAWLGFTLPSALLLIFFALGISELSTIDQGWIHALKVVAVSVVGHAVYEMRKKLCPDKERIIIALVACGVAISFNFVFTQVLIIIAAGIIGTLFLKDESELPTIDIKTNLSKNVAGFSLITFFLLLFILPLLKMIYPESIMDLVDSFYRAGSLVFGGGHVVLPLLETELVETGLVTKDLFLSGYGAAQAIPGPLFTFSAFLGAVSLQEPNGWIGGVISLVAIFLPSFLLIIGVFPFWEKVRSYSQVRFAMKGINASVVGILLAAFYHPVWTSAISNYVDLMLAALGFVMLSLFKLPSWIVVLSGVVAGFIIY